MNKHEFIRWKQQVWVVMVLDTFLKMSFKFKVEIQNNAQVFELVSFLDFFLFSNNRLFTDVSCHIDCILKQFFCTSKRVFCGVSAVTYHYHFYIFAMNIFTKILVFHWFFLSKKVVILKQNPMDFHFDYYVHTIDADMLKYFSGLFLNLNVCPA